ncbi:FtsW/RodA/SpoVE family cell cycle protein [Gorillibacterium massiliense]|uniref:FtsW/RodA/SpoVE family cell cycle protein n=1 Tax=Gorillibacterium massiliense TaxID=1280390 RepID=UPI0004BB5A2F|nr:FtsW/RodA/SpoVE family cell cycle protein [Gorillibacterium massiliense]
MLFIQKIKKTDWSIVAVLLVFMVFGTMVLISATMDTLYADKGFPSKNIMFFCMGFVAMFFIAFINYRYYLKYAYVLYGLGIVLLIGLFSPLGVERGGAKGWYDLKFTDFQPAELMKIIVIITLAAFLAKRNGEKLQMKKDVIPMGLIVFFPFLLIVAQPDMGNAIILMVILLGIYWIGNIKLTHVLIGTAIVAGFAALFLFFYHNHHDEMKKMTESIGAAHWMVRLDSFLDPANADKDKSRQVDQAKMAIGSGSLTGEGYKKGYATHNNLIYVAYSDTIFVVVGEEFGFLGSAGLLMAYFFLIYRMIIIAQESEDRNGGYMIIGIVSLYVFQIFQNIGMLIDIMPLTGITLPFISYGGTSLLINMMAIGLVMSVRIHGNKPLEE